MNSLTEQLNAFLKNYERANNSHIWAHVAPMIAPEATYWFTDGSYRGREEIQSAVETTFNRIQDEVYEIHDVSWPVVNETTAVCTYSFSWKGTVDGIRQSGHGRGTNVLQYNNGHWLIVHEHLSN